MQSSIRWISVHSFGQAQRKHLPDTFRLSISLHSIASVLVKVCIPLLPLRIFFVETNRLISLVVDLPVRLWLTISRSRLESCRYALQCFNTISYWSGLESNDSIVHATKVSCLSKTVSEQGWRLWIHCINFNCNPITEDIHQIFSARKIYLVFEV